MLKRQANRILFQNHTSPSIEAPQCSDKWATRFLDRHPELSLRKDSARELEREVVEDIEGLSKQFLMWKEVLNQYHIQIEDIYNYDESPVQLGHFNTTKMITRTRNKKTTSGKILNQESAMVGDCISVDGQKLPALIIL